MPDDRNHDHYVFQDLDLFGNNIKEVRDISSDGDLNITAGKKESNVDTTKKIYLNSDSDIDGDVYIKNSNTLKVNGTSEFEDSVTIDNNKTLTISGVRIEWDAITQSLVFIKTASAPPVPSN